MPLGIVWPSLHVTVRLNQVVSVPLTRPADMPLPNPSAHTALFNDCQDALLVLRP